MDANELRAMCELLKRNELIGVPRVVVEALLARLDAEDDQEKELTRLRRIVGCVVRNVDRMVHSNREPGDDPPILCGATWGKVAYVCGLGSTSAKKLCVEFGVDPDHEAVAAGEGAG